MNHLSIVVCTYNRVQQVTNLISRFDNHILLPKDVKLEVLIVDNNSTDSTRRTVRDFISKERDYTLNYLVEEKSGLANARNRGILEVLFEWVCFLDDDVVPENDFLISLKSAFQNYPACFCFAPKVIYQPLNRPNWYRLSGKYGMLRRGGYDLGVETRFLSENDPLPIGAAMIFRKEVFKRFGNFNPQLGYDVKRSMMVPGEETELFLKILQSKEKVLYIHDAIVNHYPTEEKWDVKTLRKIYKGIGYWHGANEAKINDEKRRMIYFGFPGAYYKKIILLALPYLASQFLKNKTIKNYYFFEVMRIVGRFKGYSDFRKVE